jgi:hypothetical protein
VVVSVMREQGAACIWEVGMMTLQPVLTVAPALQTASCETPQSLHITYTCRSISATRSCGVTRVPPNLRLAAYMASYSFLT